MPSKANTELTDHRNVSAALQSLHKGLGSRLGNGSQVVDKVGLGHTDTSIAQSQHLVLNVRNDLNEQVLAGFSLDGSVKAS